LCLKSLTAFPLHFALQCLRKGTDDQLISCVCLCKCLGGVNVLNPTAYGMHQQVEYFNNCTFCPHWIYVFCVYLKTNSDLCLLHKKNWLVVITEMKSVYSAVRTGDLNEAVCACATYRINWLVFITEMKCLQRGTDQWRTEEGFGG
jgi:hypothetical protein